MDNEFMIGQLKGSLDALAVSVRELRADVKTLTNELGEVKLFRAKVIGMSAAVAGAVSLLAQVAAPALAKLAGL